MAKNDLVHLEITSEEWRILGDLLEVLGPYKNAKIYLSAENIPTISALGPFFLKIMNSVEPKEYKSALIKNFKSQ